MARPVTLRGLITGFLAGVLVVGLLFWLWREPAAPSPEAQAALTEYVNTRCSAGEATEEEEDSLRAFGDQLERPLIDLFQSGPAPQDIRRAETAARLEIERTHALIDSGVQTGLPPEDVQALRGTSVDEWAKRAGEEFADSRRAAALAGLGITGGRKGRRLLETIAADPDSPYAEVARLANRVSGNR